MTEISSEFANLLSLEDHLSEAEIVIHAGWFLCRLQEVNSVNFLEAVEFLKSWSIRPNINSSRLKAKLRANKQVSFSSDNMLHLPIKTKKAIEEKYPDLFSLRTPEVVESILLMSDFESIRGYIVKIVWQINASYQFEIYDGCAVLMRRLAEILIIDAYLDKGLREKILDRGEIMMFAGLASQIESRKDFNIGRNVPKWLKQLKEIGDTAAHSRTYITKKIDVDDFAASYRKLISELSVLS